MGLYYFRWVRGACAWCLCVGACDVTVAVWELWPCAVIVRCDCAL